MYTHTKRQVRVTLDIECYEDLELDNINWNDVLDLQGVLVSACASLKIGTFSITELIENI
jgi:hypothetical protein